MIRACAAAALCLSLAACATAPKGSASRPDAAPENGRVTRSELPNHRKRSPYAPAQEDVSKRGDYTRGGLYAPHIRDSAPDDPLHDVDLIPEPDVTAEPRSRYGNRSPYTVLGKSYAVRDSAEGYVEQGQASYYGNKFHGRRTSNLEVYDMYAFTAAHKTLPLPSFARVTNLDNGKSVVVRVNDRGPFHDGRIIDLSYAAAVKLGYRDKGTARVEVRGLSPGEDARERYDAVARVDPSPALSTPTTSTGLPPGERIATGKPATLRGAPAPAPGLAATAMDTLVGALPIAGAQAAERPQPKEATPPNAQTDDGDWRFDMQQDGKAMSADEFDAWMKARRASVATGKPGRVAPPQTAPRQPDAPAAPPPPAPDVAAARVAADTPRTGEVTLQVASFANRQNADHALAMLRQADVGGARLLDANVGGKQVWRLRIGPVDAVRAPELAARVVGLGFGQPQRVRD